MCAVLEGPPAAADGVPALLDLSSGDHAVTSAVGAAHRHGAIAALRQQCKILHAPPVSPTHPATWPEHDPDQT
jgi:hypothetical protein